MIGRENPRIRMIMDCYQEWGKVIAAYKARENDYIIDPSGKLELLCKDENDKK